MTSLYLNCSRPIRYVFIFPITLYTVLCPASCTVSSPSFLFLNPFVPATLVFTLFLKHVPFSGAFGVLKPLPPICPHGSPPHFLVSDQLSPSQKGPLWSFYLKLRCPSLYLLLTFLAFFFSIAFLLPSFLKNIVTMCRILAWQFFFLSFNT